MDHFGLHILWTDVPVDLHMPVIVGCWDGSGALAGECYIIVLQVVFYHGCHLLRYTIQYTKTTQGFCYSCDILTRLKSSRCFILPRTTTMTGSVIEILKGLEGCLSA